MLVSALVLTVEDGDLARLLTHLSADPRLELGSLVGRRLPVVAEVPDARSGEQLVEELQGLAGVSFVDVVLVDFSMANTQEAI